jgi:tricorn protease
MCAIPSTDGKRIVYHAGADLYVLDLLTGENRLIPVELRSPRVPGTA